MKFVPDINAQCLISTGLECTINRFKALPDTGLRWRTACIVTVVVLVPVYAGCMQVCILNNGDFLVSIWLMLSPQLYGRDTNLLCVMYYSSVLGFDLG